MPEGDSVYRAARRLDVALRGRTVTKFDLRVPAHATANLTGMTVQGVNARGKHLLHRIGSMTLHTHLKMEGEWVVIPSRRPWPRQGYHARAIVGVEGADAVGFDLGIVELFPTADEQVHLGHLGPDPLGSDWDPQIAAERLAADDRPAQVALLEQRNIAGFGTIYANELMFLRGVLPTRMIRLDEAARLVDLGARMLRANVDRQRRTFTGDARPSRNLWVYGRAGKPCRRCGTIIRRGANGSDPTSERVSFWCEHCQR